MAAFQPLNVRWARRARLQLASIEECISSRNAKAAERIGVTIRSAVRLLQDLLRLGGPDVPPNARMGHPGLPHIIVYEVLPDRNELHILGVFHGVQKRPDDRAK